MPTNVSSSDRGSESTHNASSTGTTMGWGLGFPWGSLSVHSTGSAISWSDANAKCIAAGKQLAKVRTQADVDAIVEVKTNNDNIWIGASCSSTCNVQSNYYFVDGSELPPSGFPWEPKQPNGRGAQCLYIRGIASGQNNINDVGCSSRWGKQYACEAPSA